MWPISLMRPIGHIFLLKNILIFLPLEYDALKQINRLYIHVPFCQNKCAYCAFHSIPVSIENSFIDRYFAKLEKNIKESRHLTTSLQSIFIGGGTPSCLKPNDIEKLFTIISDNFTIAEKAEISIECNPESLTAEKISIIAGFANRVSIGIQSFNEKHRSIIGRIGTNKNISNVIEAITRQNIYNISTDLIYGIPTQTMKDWEEELKSVLKLPIKHLSTYALTIEEGSKLYLDKNLSSITTGNDITADMWNLTSEILSPAGFSRYEISNYSLSNYECKHNLGTWFGGGYLGLGPSASSFDGKIRWTQPELDKWLKGEKPEIDRLSPEKRAIEIFIMGLRATYGWIIKHQKDGSALLESQFPNKLTIKAATWKELNSKISNLSNDNLLKLEKISQNITHVFPTQKGLLFWNEIAMELI